MQVDFTCFYVNYILSMSISVNLTVLCVVIRPKKNLLKHEYQLRKQIGFSLKDRKWQEKVSFKEDICIMSLAFIEGYYREHNK